MSNQNEFTPFQKEWIEALKSSKYTQGRGMLIKVLKNRQGEERKEYCCLGVLCQIAADKEYGEGAAVEIRDSEDDPCVEENSLYVNGEFHCLPPALADFMNMTVNGGTTTGQDIRVKHSDGKTVRYHGLAKMNDSGFSFELIVRLLEQYPAHFFTNFNRPKDLLYIKWNPSTKSWENAND